MSISYYEFGRLIGWNILSFRCFYHGKAFTLMPPHLPLTSANICRIIHASPTRPVQHFAVSYVLKLLAETDEGTQTLAEFESVSFAGAPVPVGSVFILFFAFFLSGPIRHQDSRR